MNRRRNSRKASSAEYQNLEPRQLLAIDVGVSFTSATHGTESTSFPPNPDGDVSQNHIVQVINGNFTVFDKTGAVQETSTLDQFWTDAGATLGATSTFDPRVIFDIHEDRWFALSADEFGGNTVYLAWTDTADPTGTWQSEQFVADSFGFQFADNPTLGVDAEGIFISTSNFNGVRDSAIFAIPKDDLFAPTPSLFNMARYENLNRSVYGDTIQFAIDVNDDISGDAIGIGARPSGSSIIRTDIIDINGVGPFLGVPVNITVPSYVEAPDARQPAGAALDNNSPDFMSNVVLVDGYLYMAHTLRGAEGSSAIRWYQIDAATNVVQNTGDIVNSNFDFTNPSIDVGETGILALGFTASGPTLNASSFLSMGYTTYGSSSTPTVTFDFPSQLLQSGLGNYENLNGGVNEWGNHSATRIDPTNPFSAWTFTNFANTDNHWSVNVSESKLFAISPTLRGDTNDNVIVLRRDGQNPDRLNLVFDGVITDTFELSALDVLNIDAGDGNDVIIVDNRFGAIDTNSGLSIRGGTGLDTLMVVDDTGGHSFLVDGDGTGRIDGSDRFYDMEVIRGSEFADTFDVRTTGTDLAIYGLGGDDFFTTGENIIASVDLYGGTGDDTYRLSFASLTSGAINIIDSVGAEDDHVIGEGTPGHDELTIRNENLVFNGQNIVFAYAGIERTTIDGKDGNDQFYIQSTDATTKIFGSNGDDGFHFNSDAPSQTGHLNLIDGEVFVDGGSGRNQLTMSNMGAGSGRKVVVTADQITGFTPAAINYTADGGGFSQIGGSGIVLTGADVGVDSFDVQAMLAENTILVRGGDGADVFTVRAGTQGTVSADGQQGGDIYRVAMNTGNQRFVFVNDTGTDAEFDRMVLTGTNNDDDVVIDNEQIIFANEQIVFDQFLEVVIANTRDGNDTVTVKNNETLYLRAFLGSGNDRLIVDKARGIRGLFADGESGNDTFDLDASTTRTFITALGQEGDDVYNVADVSYASSRLDGGEGSDEYNVQFAGRTVRRIDARDTGTGDQDTMTVTGTNYIDRVDLRATTVVRATERIFYDANTEDLTVDTMEGDDIVEIYGTHAADATVLTRIGQDLVYVKSTAGANRLIVDTGFDHDSVTIESVAVGTRLGVYGQHGNDSFNIGSTSADDNGNLGRIRGRVNLNGGADTEDDRLLVNDRGATGTYGYYLTGSNVANLNGGAFPARPAFAGINYNSIEFARLDGTDQKNFFSVVPSSTVRMHIDGNLPSASELANPLRDGDFLNVLPNAGDGRELTLTGPGEGYWEFTSHEKISFEEIEALPGVDPNDDGNGGSGQIPLAGDQDEDSNDGSAQFGAIAVNNSEELILSGAQDGAFSTFEVALDDDLTEIGDRDDFILDSLLEETARI